MLIPFTSLSATCLRLICFYYIALKDGGYRLWRKLSKCKKLKTLQHADNLGFVCIKTTRKQINIFKGEENLFHLGRFKFRYFSTVIMLNHIYIYAPSVWQWLKMKAVTLLTVIIIKKTSQRPHKVSKANGQIEICLIKITTDCYFVDL